MERKFWEIAELYRKASENVDKPSYSNSQGKTLSCIDDNFCLPQPRNIDNNILTMVFANMQPIDNIYSAEAALRQGTLFPNIDKPFYGGMKR